MELIKITKENLEKEHICCAISNNKDCQVMSKKAWLAQRLDEGLVFLKGDVRGKCFIEYIPAEYAWAPIEAENYMYIDCFWVSGQYKGHGNGNLLLDACINDCKSKGKSGIAVLSSAKKLPFLSDGKYLRHKGFQLADQAEPFYELLYLPLTPDAPVPRFRDQVRSPKLSDMGFVLYYTAQCPYTAKYVPLIEAAACEQGIPLNAIKIESCEQAQNAPAPFTSYSLFYNGQFVGNEILSVKKFEALAQKLYLGQGEEC